MPENTKIPYSLTVDDESGIQSLSGLAETQRLNVDATQVAQQFRLTQREGQVVECLSQGLTSKGIASRLNISPNTVKAFLRVIMLKLKVGTRAAIIQKLFESD
jgi:DNA-binding NarL/FixJ family response regulator